MILQRFRFIVGDAGFEPETSTFAEVWCFTYMSHHISTMCIQYSVCVCTVKIIYVRALCPNDDVTFIETFGQLNFSKFT